MNITINNKTCEAKQGETLLDVLKRNGFSVPTLCHMKDLLPSGACRLCVVEVDGAKQLLPSCATRVADNMVVKTHSPRVLSARKTILELLLASHPDDCLYCNRSSQCQLQALTQELGVSERIYSGHHHNYNVDLSSPSITRDPAKCILCGRCVRVCEEIQSVGAIDFTGRGANTQVAPAFRQGLNLSPCINCGQCIMVCPTGALTEHDHLKQVLAALANPNKIVVIQHAPSVSVSLGESFGFEAGTDVCGLMTSALRAAGFKKVYDTSFTADLTIMEEGSELVERLKNNGPLPMFTSCSPGWIKFVEQFYPEMIPHLSTCKSPQQMLGALIKNYVAEKEGWDKSQVVSVSVMPCTAKKFEAERPEMGVNGVADVDFALTTRELVRLFERLNIDLRHQTPTDADKPLGERSSSGKIFGVTGGVMEAAVRSAHYLLTGTELALQELKDVRELKGLKEATLQVGDHTLKVAVVSGLAQARELLEDIKNKRRSYDFVEVMTCPGGCIAGGGQPLDLNRQNVAARMKALYKIDGTAALRLSHKNPDIAKLYAECLEKPLSHKSHEWLHTHYTPRKEV